METQNAVQKPQSVATAVNLLWASIAIGIFKILMVFYNNLNATVPTAFTFLLVFMFALIAFLIFKISVGKNWARIMFLMMFVILVLPALPLMLGEFSRSPAIGALSVAQLCLQIYALFLLFTQPGSIWFRKVTTA